MNSNELREQADRIRNAELGAAAERILDPNCPGGEHGWLADSCALARAWLAEHPADAPTGRTLMKDYRIEEWLRSRNYSAEVIDDMTLVIEHAFTTGFCTGSGNMDWSKLAQLIAGCKCGVHLTVNGHRDYYQTAESFFEQLRSYQDDFDQDNDPETVKRMIETDTVIDLQFYQNTPICFHQVYHYDLDAAIDAALKLLQERKAE